MNNLNEQFNEYDESRRMLELIREGNRFKKNSPSKKLIKV